MNVEERSEIQCQADAHVHARPTRYRFDTDATPIDNDTTSMRHRNDDDATTTRRRHDDDDDIENVVIFPRYFPRKYDGNI